MTSLFTILAVSMMIVSGFGFPGEKVKRDFKDVFAVGEGDREGDELNASVSNENGTDCSEDTETNDNSGSREMAYNRDTFLERHNGGHSLSKTSASTSASASSSSYNLMNQNNIIPK